MKNAVLCSVIIVVIMLISSCGQGPAVTAPQAPEPTKAAAAATPKVAPTPTAAPTPHGEPTPVPLTLTLSPGQSYFSLDGRPEFLFSRNITGKTKEDFTALLEYARQGGTKLLRIHLTHGWWGDPWINKDWTVNEKWAQDWDWFFSEAEASGIYILPVFGVWADWNTGRPDKGNPLWQYNPLNKTNGGPLDFPTDLFEPGSDEQKHWLAWVEALVKR